MSLFSYQLQWLEMSGLACILLSENQLNQEILSDTKLDFTVSKVARAFERVLSSV